MRSTSETGIFRLRKFGGVQPKAADPGSRLGPDAGEPAGCCSPCPMSFPLPSTPTASAPSGVSPNVIWYPSSSPLKIEIREDLQGSPEGCSTLSGFKTPPGNLTRKEFEAAGELPLGLRPVEASAELFVRDLLQRFLRWEAETNRRKRDRPSELLQQLRDCLATVAGGLLRAWGKKESLATFRSLKTNAFSGEAIGARTFKEVLQGLDALGLLHRQDGHRKHPGDSWTNRYWPSIELLRLALGHGLTPGTLKAAFQSEAPTKPPKVGPLLRLNALKVRGRKGKPPPLPIAADDRKALALELDVADHNALAERIHVTGCLPPRFWRGFKRDWDLHGRWYAFGGEGNYQQLPEADRLKITIGGEPVAEIDVAASHLTLLHGLLGLPAPEGDLYEIDGLPRDVVKAWVNATIGKGSPVLRKWAKKTKESYPVCEQFSAAEVGERVMARYPFLRTPCAVLPPQTDGADPKLVLHHRMTNIEATILSEVMRQLRQREALTLPMHDGLLVPESAVPLAMEALWAAGAEIGKVRLRLKVSRDGGEEEVWP